MTGRQSWDEVKAARVQSPERRRGYEKTGRAIPLAMEIRALREARGRASASLQSGSVRLSRPSLASKVGTSLRACRRWTRSPRHSAPS